MTCTNMIAKLFKLKYVGGKGKGLFAKDLILKGTIVSFECTRCRRISKQDFESISTMEKSFIFKYGYRKAEMDLIYFHVTKLFILTIPAIPTYLIQEKDLI